MIRAIITDQEACRRIPDENIRNYLEGHGFSFQRLIPWGFVYEYKELDDEGRPILAVFACDQADDYGRRTQEIIRMMSEMEDRSELDIFVDMGGNLYETY